MNLSGCDAWIPRNTGCDFHNNQTGIRVHLMITPAGHFLLQNRVCGLLYFKVTSKFNLFRQTEVILKTQGCSVAQVQLVQISKIFVMQDSLLYGMMPFDRMSSSLAG